MARITRPQLKTVMTTIFVVLFLGGVLPGPLRGDDDLPDNAGLRLPYAEMDMPRIKIEEAMHYRQPRDYSNQKTSRDYSQFQEDCGQNEECIKHFPDYDRAQTPHKSIDYLDVTGGTFNVYAGVTGIVHKIEIMWAEPYYSSVTLKAKIKGRFFYVKFTHIDPYSIQLGEAQTVSPDTPIGQTYADQGELWSLDGIRVKGYCRPDGRPHPFIDHPDKRCYPSHLDYQVKEIFGDFSEAKDPYKICGVLREGSFDSCRAYHYPNNRFGTEPAPLGANHLWELDESGTTIKTAVPVPMDAVASATASPDAPKFLASLR